MGVEVAPRVGVGVKGVCVGEGAGVGVLVGVGVEVDLETGVGASVGIACGFRAGVGVTIGSSVAHETPTTASNRARPRYCLISHIPNVNFENHMVLSSQLSS